MRTERRLRAIGLSLLLLAAMPLKAQALTLDEVLDSSRDHAPQVLQAMAKVRAAQGRRLAADGAFDTVFSGTADARLTGYYDSRFIGGTVTRPLETMGGQAYAGYRISGGSFPIYEDEKYTNQLGELKVGAVFSLLRDRLLDDRRFARTQADAEIDFVRNEQLLVAIGVQRRAIDAYALWVASGLRLAVLQDLLKLARERQDGFRRQVARGLKPAILLTENEQAILRRQTLVVQAEQALAVSATRLSLFLRDGAGTPRIPPPASLPKALPAPIAPASNLSALAAGRPDLKAIDIRMQQARDQLALTRNAALPRLDLLVEASQDLGDIGEGGVSRSGTESKVGLRFSVPLQQRSVKGRLAATEAELQAQGLQRRQIEEQISVELDALQTDMSATGRLVELAGAEQARAADLTRAERRRFDLGASDLFLVQVREEAEADARIRAIEAALRQTQAHAELAAASADLKGLGLAPD